MNGVVDFESDPPYVWNKLDRVTGGRAFDIGANGGMTARTFAGHFDEVVACEPAIESYQHLCSDLPENVTPLNIAVSDVTGEIELEERDITLPLGELVTPAAGLGETGTWGNHVGRRQVRAVTLADLVDEYGAPDFIKIDTEGHERPIVEGGLDFLREHRPNMVIEIHDRASGDWILEALGAPAELVRHPAYPPGSDRFHHHYWLIYTGSA